MAGMWLMLSINILEQTVVHSYEYAVVFVSNPSCRMDLQARYELFLGKGRFASKRSLSEQLA